MIVQFSHLASLCGCSKTWMDAIKFSNSHHARVNLVVKFKSEYGNQHVASVPDQRKNQSKYDAIYYKYFQAVM